MRPKVYISGPISSSGTYLSNAAFAIEVYEHLLIMGYNPMCPQLTVFAFMGRQEEVSHKEWMRCDEAWIRSMDSENDVMLRLFGKSKGADMETEFARDMEMEVFYAVEGDSPVEVSEEFEYRYREITA